RSPICRTSIVVQRWLLVHRAGPVGCQRVPRRGSPTCDIRRGRRRACGNGAGNTRRRGHAARRRRPSKCRPTTRTTRESPRGPSVVVTIGDPVPCWVAHHAVVIVGGAVAPIRIAVRSPLPAGQLAPRPLKTTYVPVAVV